MYAGKLASSSSGASGTKGDLGAEHAIDFCNTPEGYCEMGNQLGLAFAAMFGCD